MGFPPISIPGVYEVSYTTVADLTDPTPGTRRLNVTGNVDYVFGSVDAGSEPSGTPLTGVIEINGTPLTTLSIPAGQQKGKVAVSPVVPVADGDLMTIGAITASGAGGPLNLGLHVTR